MESAVLLSKARPVVDFTAPLWRENLEAEPFLHSSFLFSPTVETVLKDKARKTKYPQANRTQNTQGAGWVTGEITVVGICLINLRKRKGAGGQSVLWAGSPGMLFRSDHWICVLNRYAGSGFCW